MTKEHKVNYLLTLAKDALREYTCAYENGIETEYPLWAEYIIDVLEGEIK